MEWEGVLLGDFECGDAVGGDYFDDVDAGGKVVEGNARVVRAGNQCTADAVNVDGLDVGGGSDGEDIAVERSRYGCVVAVACHVVNA